MYCTIEIGLPFDSVGRVNKAKLCLILTSTVSGVSLLLSSPGLEVRQ